ncbi:glycosyltransferase [Thalassotalea piscium]
MAKILHLGKYHPPFMGGIENFMSALMQQQVLDGDEVSALVHHHEKKQKFRLELDGLVKVFRVPCMGTLAYAPISPLFGFYLNKIVKEEKPDLIHIHLPNLSAFWYLFNSRAKKIPMVVHWHADVLGSLPELKIKLLYPFYRLFEKALLKRASEIIVTSPVYLKSSEPLKSFTEKANVIPLGLSDDNCDIYSEIVQNDQLNLLIIGRLTYYKGHLVLLKALSELKKQGIQINLTIVGGGELKDDIVAYIDQLALSKNVRMLSNLSNDALTQELISTHLLCLPSIERTEAFGVVLLEAMRACKPCLVTDVEGSGMSWVVQDEKTGFVVKHNNINSLVEKLAYIYNNPELLTRYGLAGRRRFESEFTIQSINEKTRHLYQKILKINE